MSEYSIPSKISVDRLSVFCDEIVSKGFDKILVVTSPSVGKQSVVQNGYKQLKKNKVLSYFDKIRPDAPIADLDKLIDTFERPDLIIGIGGGSVIDSCKALSVGWQGSTIEDFFYNRKELPLTKIPTYAIPTTAGTGAELSYGAILYDNVKKIKSGLRSELLQPDRVLLDVDLYHSASSKLIAEVGFDCLTHAIETYLSTASSPLIKYASVIAVNAVFQNLPLAVQKDRRALEQMAITACLMGINLAKSTTCLPHRIQYVIGPLTETSHAHGLIMLYKGWLPVIAETEEFDSLCWDLKIDKKLLIDNIVQLKASLSIDYKLNDYGISDEGIEQIAKQVTGNVANDPSYRSIETIKRILKGSL